MKRELVSCVRTFFSKGMVSVGGGNHSFRSDEPDRIWITPSGYPRSHLTTDDLLLIDLDGNVLAGNLRPTIEVPFHTQIYKVRSDINAVCHTHNPYTLGFFLSSKLESIDEGICTLSEEPLIEFPKILGEEPVIIDYRQLGSRSLGNIVGKAVSFNYLRPSGTLILLNHGIISIGRCIHEARLLVELLEEWARCSAIAKIFS
ncbi:MAG: class II aldolase/adducin family protein [Nitrososphaerales archaeon]